LPPDPQQIIAKRKQRWRSFYDLKSEQRFMFIIHYQEFIPSLPLPNPENKTARIEAAWQKYQSQLDLVNWLDDDSIPYLDPYTGTEIFAEAFGCQVYRPSDTNPFALPLIHSASEVSRLRVPDYGSTPLALLFDIADELRSRAGPAAVMKLVDIQSPMDIAALIWDKNTFYPAMIENPEAVQELAAKVQQLLVSFIDAWFTRYGQDFMAHYPEYYLPDGGLTLSVDEIGAVSNRMFDRFFLPELVELAKH
jgi:hypothetical protein